MKSLCAALLLATMAAASVSVSAAPTAAGPEPSRNEKFGLEVTFPEKWLVGSGEEPVLLISRSTDPDARASCLATGEVVDQTKSMSQGQLNEALAQSFGKEFWQGIYKRTGLEADVKTAVARPHISGIVIQEAQFDLSKPGDDKSKVSVHQAIFITPGSTVSVACSARTVAYPKYKPTLDRVIESVRIVKPAMPVASAEPSVVQVSDVQQASLSTLNQLPSLGAAGVTLHQLSR